MLIMGKEPFEEYETVVRSHGRTLKALDLDIDFKVYGKPLRIYLAVDFIGIVQQVILRCYHGEYAYHSPNTFVSGTTDFF